MNKEERMKAIKDALKRREVYAIEFAGDSSCVEFEYRHPTGNHGMPCTMRSSLNMKDAVAVLAGNRLKQHQISTCF